ncbi:PREDICTED: tubby-like protein 8 isoform X2 [Populus euphratica]|uniref:Tubby-like protein 8 isoform X2 n=1 Tax=Populus euphratica TaxID=75702 RepID=A0AAJ6U0I3_POPEU|nr:PREDICTED: tubby-like protein 8 isoform X2 [Populus euphratica]
MQCPTIQSLCRQMGLSALPKPQLTNMKSLSTGRVLKPSSLQLCVQMNEPEKVFKSRVWNSVQSENSSSVNIWDYSDAEDTHTSSWSAMPNRPLPLDIGRFTSVILKEILPGGLRWGWGGSIVLTLYQSHFIGVVVKKIGGWT